MGRVAWTHHTHPDVTPGNGMAGGGGEVGVGRQATAVQAAVASTAVQAAVASTAVQAAAGVDYGPGGRAAFHRVAAHHQAAHRPADGATARAARHALSHGDAAHDGPARLPAARARPESAGPPGGDGAGTQVMFTGGGGEQPWQLPGMGMPGGPGQGNPYGYLQVQRRRRILVFGGVTAGVVAGSPRSR